jgi:hypothetical protein
VPIKQLCEHTDIFFVFKNYIQRKIMIQLFELSDTNLSLNSKHKQLLTSHFLFIMECISKILQTVHLYTVFSCWYFKEKSQPVSNTVELSLQTCHCLALPLTNQFLYRKLKSSFTIINSVRMCHKK